MPNVRVPIPFRAGKHIPVWARHLDVDLGRVESGHRRHVWKCDRTRQVPVGHLLIQKADNRSLLGIQPVLKAHLMVKEMPGEGRHAYGTRLTDNRTQTTDGVPTLLSVDGKREGQRRLRLASPPKINDATRVE